MQYNRPGEVMRVILPVASLLCRPLYNCIPTFGLPTPSINSPTPCPRQLLATTVPLVPPCLSPFHLSLPCSEEEKLGLCGVSEGWPGPDFDLAFTLYCQSPPPQTFKAPSWSMYTCYTRCC